MSDLGGMKDSITEAYRRNIVLFALTAIVTYLAFVYKIGPRWMKNKPAYNFKRFISCYNVMQVAACLYVANCIFSLTSWNMFYFGRCTYYSQGSPERKRFQDILFKIFVLKLVEFTDTIIFVLRKKQNQITFLHTFHHVSMFILSLLGVLYCEEIEALLGVYINCWVHVIMYTYYFFANICSAEVMKKFILIKKSITVIQMLQFCVVLAQIITTWENCKAHIVLRIYYMFAVAVIFYGFYDFFKKSYSNTQRDQLKNKAN